MVELRTQTDSANIDDRRQAGAVTRRLWRLLRELVASDPQVRFPLDLISADHERTRGILDDNGSVRLQWWQPDQIRRHGTTETVAGEASI
jgi:hypothetical protein